MNDVVHRWTSAFNRPLALRSAEGGASSALLAMFSGARAHGAGRIVRPRSIPRSASRASATAPTSTTGPEIPGGLPTPGGYKDASGAMKRQAARFRVFGLDAQGRVVRELTADDATIVWTVHLANKKASWYQFETALDIPEAVPSAAAECRVPASQAQGAGDRPRAAPSVGTQSRRCAVRHRHLSGRARIPGRAPH